MSRKRATYGSEALWLEAIRAMLRTAEEREEAGPCVSTHSLSGESTQTMDYTAELHVGFEEIQSRDVTPFGTQADVVFGQGQYVHRPKLLPSSCSFLLENLS